MYTVPWTDASSPRDQLRGGLREIWAFLAGMGVGLIGLGLVAAGCALIVSLPTVLALGILILLAAIFQITTAIWSRSWSGAVLHLLSGGLYLVLGIVLIDNPHRAAAGLTVLIAAGLITGGAIRIAYSLVERFPGRIGLLVGGILSTAFGLGIWSQWPWSGLWMIGLFLGVDWIVSGCSWLWLGLALRRMAPSDWQPVAVTTTIRLTERT